MKKAKLTLNKDFVISRVDRRIFSTFIEPIGDIVYGDIYNPGHPAADNQGFREDVIKLMRELNTAAVRYPGGNFISGYHWTDGIGPKNKRPARFEKAWRKIETNQMGIDEYTEWVKKTGAEPMLAVNLGTGTPEEASNEIEYTNFEKGTYYSDLRRKYGHEKPYGIKMWCLGNEMDGSWQLGEKTAEEYGRTANEAAKQMRLVDPDIELVACGSCANDKTHPSFPDWDRVVLEHCYENVDYLSLHRYYTYDPERLKGTVFPPQFTLEDLPYIPVDLSSFIDTVCAAADFVKGLKYSDKTINISFDEWGVIPSNTVKAEGLDWQQPVIPDYKGHYFYLNMIDAVLFGSILITFINKCDRVKLACQSITIGSIIGVKSDGGSYKQTAFYPFQHAASFADGVALRPSLQSPSKKTGNYGECTFIKSAGVYDEKAGVVTVFAVNLDLRESVEFDCDLQFKNAELIQHIQMYDKEPLAINTFDNPDRVVPRELDVNADKTVLPPLSWNVLRYKISK